MSDIRIAFAGDRDIAVWVMDFLLSHHVRPVALLVPNKASHDHELRKRCDYLPEDHIFSGSSFRSPAGVEKLQSLKLDYIVGIHFPYIIPGHVLAASGRGFLNLHPAYLPFNRGWHTPSWAILDGTPIGATLHFMDAGIDTGPIIHQKMLRIAPSDTANSLYGKLKKLELEVFQEAWPQIESYQATQQYQNPNGGTSHKLRELLQESVQKINLDEPTTARQLINRLRALTTNRLDEAMYFESGGKRLRVQVVIVPDS